MFLKHKKQSFHRENYPLIKTDVLKIGAGCWHCEVNVQMLISLEPLSSAWSIIKGQTLQTEQSKARGNNQHWKNVNILQYSLKITHPILDKRFWLVEQGQDQVEICLNVRSARCFLSEQMKHEPSDSSSSQAEEASTTFYMKPGLLVNQTDS